MLNGRWSHAFFIFFALVGGKIQRITGAFELTGFRKDTHAYQILKISCRCCRGRFCYCSVIFGTQSTLKAFLPFQQYSVNHLYLARGVEILFVSIEKLCFGNYEINLLYCPFLGTHNGLPKINELVCHIISCTLCCQLLIIFSFPVVNG